jgi:uncharacterized protein YrzB (UPF0473 family)
MEAMEGDYNMNNAKISTMLSNGTKKEYDVILTFKNEKTQKDYVVYTDNSIDDNNKLRIFATVYNPTTLKMLGNPETKEEWDEITRVIDNVILAK